jgi:hypothetical protein
VASERLVAANALKAAAAGEAKASALNSAALARDAVRHARENSRREPASK